MALWRKAGVQAADLEGKRVILGITRFAESGSYTQEQHLARASIWRHDDYDFVRFSCEDGEERVYPFEERFVQRAPKGEYRFRSTGEVVVDPDFLFSVTTYKGKPPQ